jgi:hypothetical protein
MNTECAKWSYSIPNVHKIFQMAIIYINIFQSENLKILPKLGFLVRRQTIWQPWTSTYIFNRVALPSKHDRFVTLCHNAY